MRKIFTSLFFLFSMVFFLKVAPQANAVCPVCTVAVGAGIGLAECFGINDIITGVWIGGFLMSLSLWTLSWLEEKKINFRGKKFVVVSGYYLLTLLPLYFVGILGKPFNKVCGIDKLILGVIIGSGAFLLAGFFNYYLKKKNNGKAYFPFQKVILPVIFLLISSLIIYFLIK